jgi:hypothetical protein
VGITETLINGDLKDPWSLPRSVALTCMKNISWSIPLWKSPRKSEKFRSSETYYKKILDVIDWKTSK